MSRRSRLAALLRAFAAPAGVELRAFETDALELGLLAALACLEQRSGAPVSLRAAQARLQVLAQNLPVRAALAAGVRALAAAGVPVVLYKGQDYLDRVHGDLGARPMADADVLVPPGALVRALPALVAAGFEVAPRRSWTPHAHTLVRGEVALDVHTALMQAGRSALTVDELVGRAAPAPEVLGALRLEPSDAALVHCVAQVGEAYAVGAWSYLELQALLAAADPERVLERAQRWRVRRALYCSMRVLAELGEPAAGALAARVGLGRALCAALDASVVSAALAHVDGTASSRARRLLLKAALVDRGRDAVRVAARWAGGQLALRWRSR